jgi:hypothetical protein
MYMYFNYRYDAAMQCVLSERAPDAVDCLIAYIKEIGENIPRNSVAFYG